MASVETISQIPSLKELSLASNQLSGDLPDSIIELKALESLDLHGNHLRSLPNGLRQLLRLRILNVSKNRLSSFPTIAISKLPLVELDVSSNTLDGEFFTCHARSMQKLQTLDMSNNAITQLIQSDNSEDLDLPSLQTLKVSNNRLTSLPTISSWESLATLSAEDNKISTLPMGFTSLQKLRHADFTNNNLTTLDPHIALMDVLQTLNICNNPLRERKYLSMSVADLKRDLVRRLGPEDPAFVDSTYGSSTARSESPSESWVLKMNNTLDLSSKDLRELPAEDLASFLQTNFVRTFFLHHNAFAHVPLTLSLAQDLRTLNLSFNAIETVLTAPLTLPHLQELNLSGNRISSLETLTSRLSTPNLHTFNISTNALTGALPTLRTSFPALTTLLAAENNITSISAPALAGLHVVNLSRNDIDHVPPEIGELQGTLRTLELQCNRFRVPGWRVMEKGTEEMLRWLRDRIPAKVEEDETF